MQISQERKDELDRAIASLIADLIEKETLQEYELGKIVDFYGARIDASQTEEDIQNFIFDFVEKWPVFAALKTTEHNNNVQKTEEEITQDVLSLAKEGRLEEAVGLAKTVTDQQIPQQQN